MAEARTITDGLEFPEGPVWGPDGAVYVVEIRGGRVTRVALDGTKTTIADVGGGPNGLALGPDGAFWVCNNGGFPDQVAPPGLQRVTMAGEVSTILTEASGTPLNGPNDLVFDRAGNLYFTDPIPSVSREEVAPPSGVVFLAVDGQAHRIDLGLHYPNGIALSADEQTLYVCESEGVSSVHGFPVIAPGKVGPGKRLGRLEGKHVLADGMCVDEAGNLLVAGFRSGAISVYPPEGGLARTIPVGERWITNLCFGGPAFSTLFITLSGGGVLSAVEWERPGIRLNG